MHLEKTFASRRGAWIMDSIGERYPCINKEPKPHSPQVTTNEDVPASTARKRQCRPTFPATHNQAQSTSSKSSKTTHLTSTHNPYTHSPYRPGFPPHLPAQEGQTQARHYYSSSTQPDPYPYPAPMWVSVHRPAFPGPDLPHRLC